MMLLMLLTGMMYRWNQKEISGGIGLYPRVEGDHTLEPHHSTGEGAMEAP